MKHIEAVLIYDSARTVASMGVRGAAGGDRFLLFRAGDISLDIMIHGGGHSLRLIHGQAINGSNGKPVEGVEVLIGGERVTTDNHGEFTLTTQQRDPLELRLFVGDSEVIYRVPALEVCA